METKHVWFIVLLLSCGMAAGAFASEFSGASSSSGGASSSSRPELTEDERALFEAVVLKNVEQIMNLLGGNINVNAVDSRGLTVLIRAAYNGDTEIVRRLLDNKNINVNAVDRDGHTALIWAIAWGYAETGEMLLARTDINVNAVNHNGFTALDNALDPRSGNPSVAEALRVRGARTGDELREDDAVHGGSSSH